jgi:ribokinase
MMDKQGEKRIFSPIGESTAVSIVSPDEVNWRRIDECKVVYIGEAYLELAELVASYAKSRNKLVLYRLLMPYASYGFHKINNILKNVDLLLMNERTYGILKKSSRTLRSPRDLLQYGLKTVIVTMAEKGSRVFTADETFEVPAEEIAVADTTGAGDAFAAGLTRAILDGAPIKDAIRYATFAAALSTTKPTGMASMPTKKEVDQFFKE